MNVIERCRLLAGMSEDPGNLTRTFLSQPTRDVHRCLNDWMTAAGMTVRVAESDGADHRLRQFAQLRRWIR